MPHVTIRYEEKCVRPELLGSIMEQVCSIVGRHFSEQPEYVSVEVVPQTATKLHRKDIDLEIDASPDEEGIRKKAAPDLAAELVQLLLSLNKRGAKIGEVSAWVRIFDAGHYAYGSAET